MEDRVRILSVETLSEDWGVLKKHTFDYRRADGEWQRQAREVYDRGDAATVLLYDPARDKVILTRQFRLPLYVRGEEPMLLEACAGLLDDNDPETCARKEAEEETGYRVRTIRHLFDAHMSPGSVTERLSFFLAECDADSRVAAGGGLHGEGEDIEVVELDFADALARIGTGEITDAKTIMLLQWAALNGVSRGSPR